MGASHDPHHQQPISQTTKNAWQVVDLASGSTTKPRDMGPSTTTNAQYYMMSQNASGNSVVKQNSSGNSYIQSVNVSTKLQQQVLMIPDSAKANATSVQVNKGRTSPRVF